MVYKTNRKNRKSSRRVKKSIRRTRKRKGGAGPPEIPAPGPPWRFHRPKYYQIRQNVNYLIHSLSQKKTKYGKHVLQLKNNRAL